MSEIIKQIYSVLNDYRCRHTFEADEGGLPLVDMLAPPGEKTVALGKQEMECLAEFLADELPDIEALERIATAAGVYMTAKAKREQHYEQKGLDLLVALAARGK